MGARLSAEQVVGGRKSSVYMAVEESVSSSAILSFVSV